MHKNRPITIGGHLKKFSKLNTASDLLLPGKDKHKAEKSKTIANALWSFVQQQATKKSFYPSYQGISCEPYDEPDL